MIIARDSCLPATRIIDTYLVVCHSRGFYDPRLGRSYVPRAGSNEGHWLPGKGIVGANSLCRFLDRMKFNLGPIVRNSTR
jgi:hypothetical protein